VRGLRRLVAPGARITGWGGAALAVCGLAWSLAATALVLQLVHRMPPEALAYWVMDVLSAVVYGAAVLVLLPRSRHPATWIVALVALGCGVSAVATQYFVWSFTRPGLPDPVLVALTGGWVWVPGTYATMAVLPWLVVPRRPWWTRVAAAAGVLGIAIAVVRAALTPVAPPFVNPLAADGAWLYEPVQALGLWPDRVVVGIGLAGGAWLAWHWHRAPDDEGRGFGWLAAGQLLMTLAFLPLPFVELTGDVVEASGVALILAQAFVPVALLVLVQGRQLWGVDVTVSRVTVWWVLTVAVLATYGVLAWLGGMLLPDSNGLAGFIAVGLVVALGQPLRWWIQERVDHLVYGRGADPAALLGSLSRDLGTGDRSLDALVDALRTGLRLGSVEVGDVDGVVRVRSGPPAPPDLELALVVEGRHLGRLAVSAPAGQRVDGRTRRLVEQTVGVLAVALELAQVNQQLSATSGRLVEVRHEERRMIRRDLHDGMGPALAGVGLGLAAAQRRLTHDPEGTARLLAELEAEVERRTEDVRLLARALLPPQLDEGDLGQALEVLADRFRTSGLVVEVEATGVAGVDTRQQVAVYHVAAESLMNAYRHAHATSVRVRVARRPGGGVELTVTDDGGGLDAGPGGRPAGIGVQSMRERAVELGGELEIGPRQDGAGTRVRMALP
jgi:signal transduction histidine kinase